MCISPNPALTSKRTTHLASLILLNQNLVNAERARASGEAEYKGMRSCWGEVVDPIDDVVGDVDTGLIGVVTDNEPHLDSFTVKEISGEE